MSPKTKTEAFAAYGAKLTNPRWSWSAKADDAVVLTFWTDKLDRTGKPVSYDGSHEPGDLEALGNKERLEHLVWARDHCDGSIKVVLARRVPAASGRREIEEIWAQPTLHFRLTEVNEQTGEFRAVMVDPP